MTFFTGDTQASRVRIRRIFVQHFEFSLKSADQGARLPLYVAPMICPGGGGGGGFGSFFTGNS